MNHFNHVAYAEKMYKLAHEGSVKDEDLAMFFMLRAIYHLQLAQLEADKKDVSVPYKMPTKGK